MKEYAKRSMNKIPLSNKENRMRKMIKMIDRVLEEIPSRCELASGDSSSASSNLEEDPKRGEDSVGLSVALPLPLFFFIVDGKSFRVPIPAYGLKPDFASVSLCLSSVDHSRVLAPGSAVTPVNTMMEYLSPPSSSSLASKGRVATLGKLYD